MADNDLIPPAIANGGAGSVQIPGVRAPDYRQLQNPEEVDVRRIDAAATEAGSESARSAAALAGVFKDFENTSFAYGSKLANQAGRQAGAAAGAAGNGAPKTGLQAATVYGEGYNAAVHSTYITQSQLSLEQQLSNIEGDTQGDPNAFQARATGVVSKALKQVPDLYQPDIQLWAQARIQAGVNRQKAQAQTDAQNQALATYQSATPDLITGALHTAAALPREQGDAVITKLVSDDQDRLNALVASRTITPEQAVALHKKMVADTGSQMSGQRVDISLQPILQTMRTNAEAADKMIVQPDPNLTPAENGARVQEFLKEREQYLKTQTRANVDQLTAVHSQLDNGKYGPDVEGQLHSLYKAGALSEEGLFSGVAESIRNQRSDIEDQASMQLVDDVIHGQRQGPLDPKNKQQADAVDKYFQDHVAMSGDVGSQQYASGAAEIFRQTGILPESVQSRIRIGVMSGDPVRAASAAALAAKIQGVNPTADVFVSNPKLAALTSLINDNLKAGLSPQQSYSLAVGKTDASAEVRKLRDSNYGKALTAQGPNAVALQRALDAATPGAFSHSPPAPIAMQAEYDNLTREFYDQTGDLNKARDIATTQLKQTWGVSSVNGQPELMKHPVPESLVPTVRADIASSAKDAGYDGDPSQIHLIPNNNTDASGGRMWSMVHVDSQTGLNDVLLDKNNRPLQYALPSGPDFAKARQALIDSKLAAARAERDAQRQNSADQIKFEQQLSNFYLNNPTARSAER